jgi:arylsulfatase A-like enzyme
MRWMIYSALLVASAAPSRAAGPARPNVLIVMTDDQGLGDFSYTGNPVLNPDPPGP